MFLGISVKFAGFHGLLAFKTGVFVEMIGKIRKFYPPYHRYKGKVLKMDCLRLEFSGCEGTHGDEPLPKIFSARRIDSR